MLYIYLAMEVLLFIALVIIVVLLIKIKSFQKEIAVRTQERFLLIQKELVELKECVKKPGGEIIPVEPTDENGRTIPDFPMGPTV